LRVVQHLRDEAHRFGITFHRDLRSKGQIKSELDNIKGIGPKTAGTLLREFKSVKRIREASVQEIARIVGMSKAQIVKNGLNKETI
jgi:excinuclease ABC subunit C